MISATCERPGRRREPGEDGADSRPVVKQRPDRGRALDHPVGLKADHPVPDHQGGEQVWPVMEPAKRPPVHVPVHRVPFVHGHGRG